MLADLEAQKEGRISERGSEEKEIERGIKTNLDKEIETDNYTKRERYK